MANTVVFNKHDYVISLRKRLNAPTNWKDVLKVTFSDVRTINNAYLSTEPSVVGGTRGTAYNYEDFALTQDVITLSGMQQIPMFIDEADRFQQSYFRQMEIAEFQGRKINEKLESLWLAKHGDFTDFGAGDLANTSSNDTTQITVSSTNIDDMIRAMKRKIRGLNGGEIAREKGYFIVWRAADYELLEGFVMANGFTTADLALKSGVPESFHYMGVDHYLSNSHTANHVLGGVKGIYDLGILRGTYGKAKFIEDPAKLSGLGIVSRVDYGFVTTVSTENKKLLVDFNVA